MKGVRKDWASKLLPVSLVLNTQSCLGSAAIPFIKYVLQQMCVYLHVFTEELRLEVGQLTIQGHYDLLFKYMYSSLRLSPNLIAYSLC